MPNALTIRLLFVYFIIRLEFYLNENEVVCVLLNYNFIS